MKLAVWFMLRLPSKLGDMMTHVLYGHKQGESEEIRLYYKKRYKIEVGKYTYGGCFCKKFNGGVVTVGRYCSIAQDVCYFGANHPMDHISTSAFFFNKSLSAFDVKDVERSRLIIGNDVWIGKNAIITHHCKKIGTGAVIGAGSVVTKDVDEYAIVAGNPAKLIRYRFTEAEIEMLKQTEWWNDDFPDLMQLYEYRIDPVQFSEKFLQQKDHKEGK